MTRQSMDAVLLDFAKTMIKDLGAKDGRAYLLRNVSLWRETYGETVATKVVNGIRALLKAAA
jgi:hypothetical protein